MIVDRATLSIIFFWLWMSLALTVLLAPLSLSLGFFDGLRVPVLLAAAIVLPVVLIGRHFRHGIIILLISLALLAPWAATGRAPAGQDSRRISLVMLPSSSAQAIAYALAQRPDLILIPDLSDATRAILGPQPSVLPAPTEVVPTGSPLDLLTANYSPWILKTADGIGIFIQSGTGNADDIRVRDMAAGSRVLIVDAKLAGTEMTLAVAHLTRPFPLAAFGQQADEIRALSAQLADIPRPIILAGDFNALPWSAGLERLSDAMAASNAQWAGTFPAGSPIRLALDQIRVSGDLQIVSLQAGPDVGSVHLPLEAVIALPPR